MLCEYFSHLARFLKQELEKEQDRGHVIPLTLEPEDENLRRYLLFLRGPSAKSLRCSPVPPFSPAPSFCPTASAPPGTLFPLPWTIGRASYVAFLLCSHLLQCTQIHCGQSGVPKDQLVPVL